MSHLLGIRRVLVIYGHPARNSLNGAILATFLAGLERVGIEHRVRDLCGMGFDPVLGEEEWRKGFAGIVPEECRKEQEHLLWADALVWVFPAWNFSLPAILKGYLDRVFVIPGFSVEMDASGTAYRGGLLQHKKALVMQTLGGELATGYRFGNVSGYVQPLVSSLHYTGIRNVHVAQFWNLYKEASNDSAVQKVLDTVRRLAEESDLAGSDCIQIACSLSGG